jgi:hypothetical protein
MQALLFLEGLVASGLLGCEVGVALFESGEENGVFVSQNGVFVSENGVFLAKGLGLSLCGGKLLVPPVQRLIAELLGLVLPFERLGVELICGFVVMGGVCFGIVQRCVKSIDV